MKVEMLKPGEVKGADREVGEHVIVRKEEGERLIEQGLANRVIEGPENRIRGLPEKRFSSHTRFTAGVGFP